MLSYQCRYDNINVNVILTCALMRLMRFKRLISLRARSNSAHIAACSILVLISMSRSTSGSCPSSAGYERGGGRGRSSVGLGLEIG